MKTPVMRGRLATALAAALSVGLLAAGCGVPTSSGVHVDGSVAGEGAADSDQPRLPPGPDEARDAEQLVDYFLQAAAGDPVDPVEQLRSFVHSDHQDSWAPSEEVLLVRVADPIVRTPLGVTGHRFELEVQVVGVLRDGMIVARERPDQREYQFEVIDEAASGPDDLDVTESRWRIVNPPEAILLSDAALSVSLTNPGYLEPRPIYFWDSSQAVLVPDLRWLPTAFPARQRAQLKLQWLIEGPSPWLDSVTRLPGDVGLEGNIIWNDDRVDVTLTPSAKEVEPRLLDTQVWWTLRGEVGADRDTWLSIDGTERLVAAEDGKNAAADRSPVSFVVVDDAVVPYLGHDADEFALPDISSVAEVQAAAVNRDGVAAVVHPDGAGAVALSIVAEEGLAAAGLSGAEMSRPVWLAHPGGIGLVAVDGELHVFAPGQEPVELAVPGVTGPVTALAAAPDGRRLALIAGGELYVTSLARRGEGITAGAARWLPTTGRDLAGVTFLQENWLAVVGREGSRSLLYELTIDGAMEGELTSGDLGAPRQVDHVVGYPADVLLPAPQRGEIMYFADGFVYRYRYPNAPASISVAELGLDPETVLSRPRAPFFLE